MNSRHLLSVAIAVGLTACGGGGSDSGPGPGPGPAPVVPESNSSLACFNEADLREGTVLEVVSRYTQADGVVDFESESITTLRREAFAGARPVPRRIEVPSGQTLPRIEDGAGSLSQEYYDLVDGKLLRYGVKSFDTAGRLFSTGTSSPPSGFPVDMKPGEVHQITYDEISRFHNDVANEDEVERIRVTRTYEGRETAQFVVGTFGACKFTEVFVFGEGSTANEFTVQRWVAAQGPYRGQDLKVVGWNNEDPKAKTTVDITRMVYSPK